MTETISAKKGAAIAPPSDTKQVWSVAKYDILKHLRSRRLIGMIIIEVLVLGLLTLLPPVLGNDYPSDADSFINTYAGFTSTLVIIGATLFAGDAIVSEYQSRTGFLLFPTPVKKMSLLAGKFLASTLAMSMVLVIYYSTALVLGLIITGGFSTLGVESLLLAMLYSIAALSIGYLISSLMKGSAGALILTFALFFFIFSILTSVLSVGNVDPWFILSFAGQVIPYITQVPYPTSSSNSSANGLLPMASGSYVPDVGVSIAVMLAYAIAALALSYLFFKRRDMTA